MDGGKDLRTDGLEEVEFLHQCERESRWQVNIIVEFLTIPQAFPYHLQHSRNRPPSSHSRSRTAKQNLPLEVNCILFVYSVESLEYARTAKGEIWCSKDKKAGSAIWERFGALWRWEWVERGIIGKM